MEGFLQSLKFEDPEKQREICQLIGKQAKRAGRNQPWYATQQLYWQGLVIERDSLAYQQLLTRAYDALAENPNFRNAILATGDEELDHSIGKDDETRTILTRNEFVGQLIRLRSKLQTEQSSIDVTNFTPTY